MNPADAAQAPAGGRAPIDSRTLWIPQMSRGGSVAFAAALRAFGVEARVCPDSDEHTLALAARHTSGDECLPARVTLGAFLAVTDRPDFDPDRHAFFMPTADGPCRFGQYAPYIRQVLVDLGLGRVAVVSPSSRDGYQGLGDRVHEFMRHGHRALVAADILRKLLHRVRPYEVNPGDTDGVHARSLESIERVLERPDVPPGQRMTRLETAIREARDEFRRVVSRPTRRRLLIGVVGEIFCRLTPFTNDSIVQKIEALGGEVVLAHLAEWIEYTNLEVQQRLRRRGRRWSRAMVLAKLTERVQHHDAHRLHRIVRHDLRGREEPAVRRILRYGEPYLPHMAALGEMALSVGKSVFHFHQGCDGVADVSPFTCMNGIVTEAVYPRVSADLDGVPIRNFFVDSGGGHLDRDLEIFMELARSYRARKRITPRYPAWFPPDGGAGEAGASRG